MARSPVSPAAGADAVVRVLIQCDGVAQPDLSLISVTVRHAFNDIPWARLVLADGDMPTGGFPLSDSELFKPGAEVTVKAGYGDAGGGIDETLFTGIVVRHGISIGAGGESRLNVECRARACRMAVARRTAHHLDQTDSDVVEGLIGGAGLVARVAAGSIRHEALVQHDCSDWDFMLARADATGWLVNVEGDTVSVQPPTNASPALELTWGADLIDFEADIDARTQWTAVQASSWSPGEQAVVQSASMPPRATIPANGDLGSAALAATASPGILALQTSAPQPKAVLDTWAKAVQLKAELARVRGRMSFQGSALAKPGAWAELKGVGRRFSGPVLLSSVEHEIVEGNWVTRAAFGLDPTWHVRPPGPAAAAAGGLVPGVGGLQIGVVLRLDADPLGEHRVLVRLPACPAATEGLWARLLHPQASSGFGSFFLPEIGDEVLIGHLDQDPGHPVVLGSLYSSHRKPPHEATATNDIKAIVTRSRHRIEFNDADKVITITTPSGNRLVFSDQDRSVVVQDQNANRFSLSESGITLDSPKDITLAAQGGITLDAVGAIRIQSKGDLKLDALNITGAAQVALTVKGGASAELSAPGQTTVKGAMVMIN